MDPTTRDFTRHLPRPGPASCRRLRQHIHRHRNRQCGRSGSSPGLTNQRRGDSLDVRTPEEFAEGHIDGAILVDFYDDDFAEQLAQLDPDVPYLLYCRSGNRSGQTRAILSELGFTDVADVDGGIVSWTGQGLPTVTP